MKYIIATLGCKVNQYETQAMETFLHERGHEPCAPGELAEKLTRLPGSLSQAQKLARASDFVAECLPGGIVDFFCR